jgi:c-di-GMP-binding flagellar brake protein YcgR
MSLIAVENDKLVVGLRLPWTLYDQDRKVLMERGRTIETEAERQRLLSSKPLREMSLQAVTDNRAPHKPASEDAALESALSNTGESRFTFQDMRLRAGDRIQLQPPASIGPDRYLVRLLGYLENGSLMVTAPVANGLRVPVREHDKIVARVFCSEKAFGFDCTVLRVCKLPYDYLHLSFPDAIQGAVVRKSPRIRTRIIAAVAKPGTEDHTDKVSGAIVNLSAGGALVKARQALAGKSQEIVLSFRVTLHDIEAFLAVRAIVRNVYVEDDKDNPDDRDPLRYHHGVQFMELPPNDRMILQSLIYQQMIEQPHSLA